MASQRINTNPWGDALGQAVGAMYKYYMTRPTQADMDAAQMKRMQLEQMIQGTQMGPYTMQNLSPEIRNDLYRRQLENTGDSVGAQLFGHYVNKPAQLDAGDTKYIVDMNTGQPVTEYGVGIAPSRTFDKEGNRLITMPAVPSQNRPTSPQGNMADLFGSVIQQESNGNPAALSPEGAAGIAQIMPATARDPGYGVQPLQGWDGVDPRTASIEEQMRFGKDYMNAMINRRGGNVAEGLAAYNAGPGTVNSYDGIPPYPETQKYVTDVSARAGIPRTTQSNSAMITPLPDLQKQDIGRAQITNSVMAMINAYNNLKENSGVVSSDQHALTQNLPAYLMSTDIGQGISQALGTENQKIRNDIINLKPTLINMIRQVTGMSAKAMDSNTELQFYLRMLGDPKQDIKSSLGALQIINDTYGLSVNKFADPAIVDNLRKKAQSILQQSQNSSSMSPGTDAHIQSLLDKYK